MPLKRKILLPLSGISLASPKHITLHLKQERINRVSPIQSTISCTVSLITYNVLLSVSCDHGVFSSELMTKIMHSSLHLCYKSYVYQIEVEHFFRSGNHTHICFKKNTFLHVPVTLTYAQRSSSSFCCTTCPKQ